MKDHTYFVRNGSRKSMSEVKQMSEHEWIGITVILLLSFEGRLQRAPRGWEQCELPVWFLCLIFTHCYFYVLYVYSIHSFISPTFIIYYGSVVLFLLCVLHFWGPYFYMTDII